MISRSAAAARVLHLLSARPNLHVVWVVFSSPGEREREARTSASLFLQQAREQSVIVKKFRDGFFPYQGADIKEFFEELKKDVRSGFDLHPLSR